MDISRKSCIFYTCHFTNGKLEYDKCHHQTFDWHFHSTLFSKVSMSVCSVPISTHVSTHCSKSSSFVHKFNFDFPKKLSRFFFYFFYFIFFFFFFLWKARENVVVLGFLAVDNFYLSRKIFCCKTSENVGVLSKLNFSTKLWLFE